MKLHKSVLLLPVSLLTGLTCMAQTPPVAPAFDAASIRPAEGGNGSGIRTSPGTLTARNQNLQLLIAWANDVPNFQITGPDWLTDVRFDVMGKSESGGDDAKLRLMLRKLLAERFGVKTHPEQKEMQVYAITLAKGGPKFQETTEPGPPVFDRGGPTLLTAHRVTMRDFAQQVSGPLRRPVIDETGLTGKYEIKIDVAAYMQSQEGGGTSVGEQIDVMSVLFNALQAQLGVKLESKKANVNLIVVDHAEKTPTEN